MINAIKASSTTGKYIIELGNSPDIDSYINKIFGTLQAAVPIAINSTVQLLSYSRTTTKTSNDSVQLLQNVSIGNFRAITVSAHSLSILQDLVKDHPDILSIVPDVDLTFDLPKPMDIGSDYAKRSLKPRSTKKYHESSYYSRQSGAPWNLLRISERNIGETHSYGYRSTGGQGITVYVVDDGVDTKHPDFEGRAKFGWTAISKEKNGPGGGHGTHVAGIIAGKHYGVAKKAKLVSVQVLDKNGRGSMSNLIAGLDWVAKHAKRGSSIVNLSLGVDKNTPGAKALNQAVNALVEAGIPVFVAAGNSASDACNILPAGNKNVFAVAAIDNKDVMDPNACYGKCVGLFAPGVDVTSDYLNNKHATMSGSSMASPHIAGLAALELPHMVSKKPADIYKAIIKRATTHKIKKLASHTVNGIAYSKF
ncbi:peptidase S8/S53 domain-containing protein [Umbelopsis sp. PMI_123]|nr:peptidase S8/S53 domain-containing protein [Umbelopsis sp. PMI_123]